MRHERRVAGERERDNGTNAMSTASSVGNRTGRCDGLPEGREESDGLDGSDDEEGQEGLYERARRVEVVFIRMCSSILRSLERDGDCR